MFTIAADGTLLLSRGLLAALSSIIFFFSSYLFALYAFSPAPASFVTQMREAVRPPPTTAYRPLKDSAFSYSPYRNTMRSHAPPTFSFLYSAGASSRD